MHIYEFMPPEREQVGTDGEENVKPCFESITELLSKEQVQAAAALKSFISLHVPCRYYFGCTTS